MGKIVFRAVIEVAGKPKEHVEQTLKDYVANLKEDERYNVLKEVFAEVQKHEEEEDLWACFAEVEVDTDNILNLTHFGFEFMPAMIEIIEPQEMKINQADFSEYLSDLQFKLHQVDMIAKQVKFENEKVRRDMAKLLKNYVVILLGKGGMSLEQLSKFTGVKEEPLGDYMDKLLDERLVKLEKDIYSLNREELDK